MKRFAVLCLAALLCFAAAGCGKKSGSEAAAPGEKALFWTSHTPPSSDALEKIVAAYNAANPANPVEMAQVPGSQTEITKLMTAVRGGTGPDVYLLDRFTVCQRAADGLLTDITDELNKLDPELSSKYLDFAWEEVLFKKRVYAVPFDTNTRAMYYRFDMLREAGIDPDVFHPKHGPMLLDTLVEYAARMTKTDERGNYTQMGMIPYDRLFGQGNFYSWGYIFGGSFADIKGGKATPSDPGVQASLQWVYDMAKLLDPQKVQAFTSAYAPPNFPPQQHPFITKKVGIMFHGDWQLASMDLYAPDVEFGVTYFPILKPGDKPVSWVGGWSCAVPTGSKKIDAATRFILWMAGAEGQRIYTRDTLHLPTYAALLDEADLFPGHFEFMKSLLPVSKARPVLPVGALYWDRLASNFDKVALNLATPAEVAKLIEDEVNLALARYLPLE